MSTLSITRESRRINFVHFKCGNCGKMIIRKLGDVNSRTSTLMCSLKCWQQSPQRKLLTKKILHTDVIRNKISQKLTGKARPDLMGDKTRSWKGDKAGYHAIHIWLVERFGKASKCEGKSNRKTHKYAKRFGYVLIYDEQEGHYRDRYIMLCSSCRVLYNRQRDLK
jgi:predicted RNA-binding Zn-ribbon protein involved in translation (DUF1610 family)